MKSFGNGVVGVFMAIALGVPQVFAGEPHVPTKDVPNHISTQTTATPSDVKVSASNAITGDINIVYNTRVQTEDDGSVKPGVADVYTLSVHATNTVLFQGTIEHVPTIFSNVLGRVTQSSNLKYALDLILRNPNNLEQKMVIGKMVGVVPIDKNGVYRYTDGNLRIAVNSAGKAAGFESKFQGLAAGKPPKNNSSLGSVKKKAFSLTRMVKGKEAKISVTDYDEMVFNDFVMAAGPVKAFPETRVNGKVVYDYERGVWYFIDVVLTYIGADGKTVSDKLSGNIKWTEDPNRSSNGLGEYQFDVRVNEPQQTTGESATFQSADNESDFFTSDPTLPCLTGTMKYKDTIRSNPNAGPSASDEEKFIVASSAVSIILTPNNLGDDKTRIVNLFKLLGISMVVPMNAE